MQMKLVGVAPVNFVNNAGTQISGLNIFVLYKDENVDGFKAAKFFLKEGIELPKDVKVNDTVEVCFNMRGRVEKIDKA
jgi:hypothetical protein